MHRETLIAVLLGFSGGILVALFLILLPKNLPKDDKQSASPTPQVIAAVESDGFTLESITDGQLISADSVKISGKTAPGIQLVISSPVEDLVITANDQGDYSGIISLVLGENLLSVTVFKSDTIQNKQIKIFSKPEDI